MRTIFTFVLLLLLSLGSFAQPTLNFSPGGELIASEASGGPGGPVKIWEVSSGKLRATLNVPNVSSLAFSPDGKYLVTGSYGEILCIWDAATGRRIHQRASGRKDPKSKRLVGSYKIQFQPKGNLFVTTSDVGQGVSSADYKVRLWDPRTGQIVATLRPDAELAVFDPAGGLLAYASRDGLHLWDIRASKEIAKTSTRVANDELLFSPDGQTLAFGDDDQVKLWNWKTGAIQTVAPGLMPRAFSSDGSRLLVQGKSRDLTLWDLTSKVAAGPFKVDSVVVRVALTNEALVASDYNGVVKIWDLKTAKQRARFDKTTGLIELSPDGKLLALGGQKGDVTLIEMASGQIKKQLGK